MGFIFSKYSIASSRLSIVDSLSFFMIFIMISSNLSTSLPQVVWVKIIENMPKTPDIIKIYISILILVILKFLFEYYPVRLIFINSH